MKNSIGRQKTRDTTKEEKNVFCFFFFSPIVGKGNSEGMLKISAK